MQFRLQVGEGSDVQLNLVGQFNDSASSPTGNMLGDVNSAGDINGGGDVNDLSGILAAPDEALSVAYTIACD